MNQIQSVLTSAPLRISFLGGGSDIESFYSKHIGSVISAAINKYVYVHVKKHDLLFQEKYRISYSEVEHVQNIESIKNDIVRNCLEFLDIQEALQISTSSDLPAFSGLGSSSSFTVALLLALHAIKGEEVSHAQLAEEACFIEIKLLNSPVGKQDQYAAAFGGLNFYEFHADNKVKIEPIVLSVDNLNLFFDHCRMIWTGKLRDANSVLSSQEERSKENFPSIKELVSLAHMFRDSLNAQKLDIPELGNLILRGWELKKTFSSQIVSTEVNFIESKLDSDVSFGHKLLGAGAGGFMLALLKNPKSSNIFEGHSMFQPNLDNWGARILASN